MLSPPEGILEVIIGEKSGRINDFNLKTEDEERKKK